MICDMRYAQDKGYTIWSGYAQDMLNICDMFRICERLTKSLCAVPCTRLRRRPAWGSTNKKVFFLILILMFSFQPLFLNLKRTISGQLLSPYRPHVFCLILIPGAQSSDVCMEIWYIYMCCQPGPLKGHHLLVKTQGHGPCLGGNRKSRWDLHWELERSRTLKSNNLKGHTLCCHLKTIETVKSQPTQN